MSVRVSSDALSAVARALDIAGRGAQVTEFNDGVLDQVLDVTPLVRRGRTIAAGQGIFTGILQNVHTGAETLSTEIPPYEPDVGVIPPYPSIVPPEFDIWLLSAAVRQVSGSGTILATLGLDFGGQIQGWGKDDSGVAVVGVREVEVAFWDALATVTAVSGLLNGSNGPWFQQGIRIPRSTNTQLIFRSTSSATATFACQMLLGMFPAGLGQDGIV